MFGGVVQWHAFRLKQWQGLAAAIANYDSPLTAVVPPENGKMWRIATGVASSLAHAPIALRAARHTARGAVSA